MEWFDCKTKIISGADSLSGLKAFGIQKMLLVADPFFVSNGWADKLLRLSGASESQIFDKVSPDPTVELAAEGTQLLRQFQPDSVVALGGGSTIDLAKAMVHFSGQRPKLIAIPTTSGSGSEVTDFAVLTHGGVKHPLVSEELCPDAAILDGALLTTQPKALIADTGFDVLTHALESYVAKNSSPITRVLAKEAFTVAYAKLPASYAGDSAVREKVHLAATMAGMAFTKSGLGLCHAMAHVLGGEFHLSHGKLCAILLPWVIDCNAQFCPEKYASLAKSAGFFGSADAVAVRNLKNGLCRLRKQLGMPQSLFEAGIDPRLVQFKAKELTRQILQDACCQDNPIAVEDFMVQRILEGVAK